MFAMAYRLGPLAAILLAPSIAFADPVLDVNATLLSAIRSTAASPPVSSRAIAMVDIAMYDAVNAASGLPDQAYAYKGSAVANASADAAAYTAGYGMMAALFPTLSTSIQATQQASLSALNVGAAALSNGAQLGTSVAASFYAQRASDGSAAAQTHYTYGTGPGAYQSTSAATQPLLPSYGAVTPFVIASGSQFRPGPPPAVGSAAWIASYNEVKSVGCVGCSTPGNAEIARFWSDIAGTETPPGHWLDITDTVAASAGLDTLGAARLTAMVGASVADAAIAAWDTKYTYDNWRPVTAIHTCTMLTCGVDGDPAWQPLWGAPNFPGYISGHSTFSGAAATALADYFGTDDVAFCDQADPKSGFATPDTRCFTSFSSAAAEAGQSRILGGIHFQFDNVAGLQVGEDVGAYVAAHAFAVGEPHSLYMLGLACGALLWLSCADLLRYWKRCLSSRFRLDA